MWLLIFTKIFRCSGSSCIISQALAQDWRKVLEILEKLRKLFPWTSILEKIGILSSRPSGVVIEGSSVLYHLLIWLVLIVDIIFNFQFCSKYFDLTSSSKLLYLTLVLFPHGSRCWVILVTIEKTKYISKIMRGSKWNELPDYKGQCFVG